MRANARFASYGMRLSPKRWTGIGLSWLACAACFIRSRMFGGLGYNQYADEAEDG